MNLARWFTNRTPSLMLRILSVGHPRYREEYDRKLRLFAVACWRRVWDMLPDDCLRALVEAQEAFADGLIGEPDLGAIHADVVFHNQVIGLSHFGRIFDPETMSDATSDLARFRFRLVTGTDDSESIRLAKRAECRVHSDLLRDIFEDPFRNAAIDPSWHTWNGGTIPGLALSIYQENAFDRLPILADALEEAGCADAALLSHCRRESAHVRGCWALDSLLGRR
jgi:hypothetical protein